MSNLPKVAKVTIKTESVSPYGLKFSVVFFQMEADSVGIDSTNEFVLHFKNGKTYPPDSSSNQNYFSNAESDGNGGYSFPPDYDNVFAGNNTWEIEKIEFRASSSAPGGWQALPGDPSFAYENESPFVKAE